MKQKLLFGLFWLILLSCIVSGAHIKGNIYDIELNQLSGVRVEINTVPKQVLIATNGSYSFNVPDGRYTITAFYPDQDLKIKEFLVIQDQGTYNLDLILLPDLEAEEEILNEASDISIIDSYLEPEADSLKRLGIALMVFLLIGIAFLIWAKLYKKKAGPSRIKEVRLSKDLEKIVDFIRQQGGRTTQKDIRMQFPQSEAKVSLMITELEDKGLIKRIKKGRGNVIILK